MEQELSSSEDPPTRLAHELLRLLQERGAKRLLRVTLRNNASTIWSLTSQGQTLNLHKAFSTAPLPVVDAFVVICESKSSRSRAFKESTRVVREWPPLEEAMSETRALRGRDGDGETAKGRCCGSVEQRRYLLGLYRHLNETRFDGILPDRVPLRFSNRMKSRIGQMVPGMRNNERVISEIALNIDLMLPENGEIRRETLLHEMAHAADYLFDGEVGHGPTWRRWARKVGCAPTACTERRIRRRGRSEKSVAHVPKLAMREVQTTLPL